MPIWLRRLLFVAILLIVGFVEGLILFPISFEWFAIAVVITGLLAVGWL
jgi:hypothetical protein